LKSTAPALTFAGFGAHPCGVSETVTVAELSPEPAAAAAALCELEPELEQPASTAASAAPAATAANGSARRLPYLVAIIGLLTFITREAQRTPGGPRWRRRHRFCVG
jgi:hypothetical protein